MLNNKSIGLLVVTRNEENNVRKCLEPVLKSEIIDKILVIDSSSDDSTPQIVKNLGVDIFTINTEQFNHGATRELGRTKLATDIVIMLTADAFALDSTTFYNLVKPIAENNSAVTYARQIPQDGADIFESFPRQYNYGLDMQVRTWRDIKIYGVFTFFCSNSCAAYDNKLLSSIGGFKTVLTNEDYLAAFDLLKAGNKITYVPDAIVKHSHSYTLSMEFKRYFDTGYIRSLYPEIQKVTGNAENRGISFTLQFFKHILHYHWYYLPYAIIITITKWLGFRFGFYGKIFPLAMIKKMSLYKFYWESQYYNNVN
jgi:rhamnosyltransferase